MNEDKLTNAHAQERTTMNVAEKIAAAIDHNTAHFNRLTPAEQERLAILIEECSEVVQSACKILRHGYESCNPKIAYLETNREALQRELGDLSHAMQRMIDHRDIDASVINERRIYKGDRIKPYLHHQEESC